jgi:hypothetical protein
MAFSAATSQATVQAALESLSKAYLALQQYMLVNNPGLLSTADAAATAAKNAIITLQT